MEDRRWLELVAAFMQGRLTAAEEEDLSRALAANPERAAELQRQISMDALILARAGKLPARVDLLNRIEREIEGREAQSSSHPPASVRAADSPGGFSAPHAPVHGTQGTHRSRARRFAPSSRSPWTFALAAAGLLFAFILFAAILRWAPDRSHREESGAAPQRAEREAQARRTKMEEERQRVEARLREIERERERILARTSVREERPDPVKEEDLRKKAEEAFARLQEERRALEEELRKAKPSEETVRKVPEGPLPEGPRVPAVVQETRAAVGAVERVEGEVWVVGRSGRAAAQAKQAVRVGEGLEVGEKGLAVVVYPDQTRVEVTGPATVREFKAEGGKRIFIDKGTVRAEVAKQPKGEPMVLESPHGEATIVGTTLRIVVDPDPKKGTLLEVGEGRVKLRNMGGKTVDVPSGHYAVAAVGVELIAKPLPIEDIVLVAAQAKVAGLDWKKAKDPQASASAALEALRTPKDGPEQVQLIKTRSSYVEFGFQADADRDYYVWIRGVSVLGGTSRSHDSIVIEPVEGSFKAPCPRMSPYGMNAFVFDGYRLREGYWWVGGDAERGDDEPPACIRFSKPGRQTLRMYVSESPMRVDLIWLSATQKTRPKDRQTGPETR